MKQMDAKEFQEYIDWVNERISLHIRDGEVEVAEKIMDVRDEQIKLHWEAKE